MPRNYQRPLDDFICCALAAMFLTVLIPIGLLIVVGQILLEGKER